MGRILKITAQKRHSNRFNVFLDNDERISVTDDLILDFSLSSNMELDDDTLESLRKAADFAFTREKALELLSLRDHAAGELRTKLFQKGYQKDAIAAAITYLQEKNYLNDARFAKLYTKELIERKQLGPAKIREKLYQRGLHSDLINENLQYYDDETQIDNCRFHILKKYKTVVFDSREEKAKVIRYLQGKGFTWSTISLVIQ